MQRESIQQTFKVAIGLCLVCSVVVSSLAVGLKERQAEQKETFRKKNILLAAQLLGTDEDLNAEEIADRFEKQITTTYVDLETNKPPRSTPDRDALNTERAVRSPEYSDLVTSLGENVRDIAGIRNREKYTTVYEVREGDALKTLVIPVRGYGLWSTLWGFIALDMKQAAEGPEQIEVAGLTYYKHGETPGLGGEVDNPLWKNKWPGKHVYDSDWNVAIEVAKNAQTDYQVDAISGATLTSNGVTNMLQFWLGEQGFGPYLKRISGTGSKAADTAADTDTTSSETASSDTTSSGDQTDSDKESASH